MVRHKAKDLYFNTDPVQNRQRWDKSRDGFRFISLTFCNRFSYKLRRVKLDI